MPRRHRQRRPLSIDCTSRSNSAYSMRGIGDPRAAAVLASLPEKGLRGCAILSPKIFFRSSYSGPLAGRGGGAGRGGSVSPQTIDGAAFGRGFPLQEISEQRESDDSAATDDVPRGRFTELEHGAQAENRVSFVVTQHQQRQQRGAVVAAGRGRGIPYDSQQNGDAVGGESVDSPIVDRFGRGRGSSLVPPGESGQIRWGTAAYTLLRSGGSVGKGMSLGGNVGREMSVGENVGRGMPTGRNVDKASEPQISAALDGDLAQRSVDVGEEGSEQGSNNLDHSSPAAPPEQSKISAVESLLFKLSESEPHVSVGPESLAPKVSPKLPFRMPFARPLPASQQQELFNVVPAEPVSEAQICAPSSPLGRGRGQPGMAAESMRSPRRVDCMPKGPRRDVPRPSSPLAVQLSVEEARARAIAILEKGIERNVAAEGERRRKAGIEKFADATEFLTDRLNRAAGPSPPLQPQRFRNERQKLTADSERRDRPRQQRFEGETMIVSESSVATYLTPEQEAELVRLQEEDTFRDRLHTLFLTQFEPEFAMEEFGRNPDIDEQPVLLLEEYLQSHKSVFLPNDAGLSLEQKWQEAVRKSLANAPQLEKLVEAYAGPGRITARQQIEKLQTIFERLPPTISPEVAAFTERAFLTLQIAICQGVQDSRLAVAADLSGDRYALPSGHWILISGEMTVFKRPQRKGKVVMVTC